MSENLRKINQNKDVRKRTISGVRQLKEYFYNKRANLTHEEIGKMIDNMVHQVLELGYKSGWEDREEIVHARRSHVNWRSIKVFNVFYDRNIKRIPPDIIEELRFCMDVMLGNRYYNENYSFDKQVNNHEIF